MYKDPNVVSLGDAIRLILNKYRLDQKFNEAGLINSWEQVVGVMIARHTVQLSVFRRTLFVEVDSASLRNELTYAREKIKKALNKVAGADIIDEVVFKWEYPFRKRTTIWYVNIIFSNMLRDVLTEGSDIVFIEIEPHFLEYLHKRK